MPIPDKEVLRWAAGKLGGGEVTVVRGLREGGSPWLLQAGDPQAGERLAVLRTGEAGRESWFATEAAAISVAITAGIAAPAVLGYDDGSATGIPQLLLERLPGSSRIPRERDEGRLRALGAAAARIHAVDQAPSASLPPRDRSITEVDFDQIRREQGASRLLLEAEEIVASTRPDGERIAFVHGDLWHGNTMWDDGEMAGIIDWDMAGTGPAGVDLGSLRCDAALCYGPEAADDVLAGWEEAAGHPAANVGYWDAVAALCSPPDMGWFVAAIGDQGRPDLDRALLIDRRDAFLRQGLSQLS